MHLISAPMVGGAAGLCRAGALAAIACCAAAVLIAPRESRADIVNVNNTIFDENGVTVVHSYTLANPHAEAYDRFGEDIAISGDFVLVGASEDKKAPGQNTSVEKAGNAYLYDLSKTSAAPKTLDRTGDPVDLFGFSVALSGRNALVGATGFEDEDSLLENIGSGSFFTIDSNGDINAPERITGETLVPDTDLTDEPRLGTSAALAGKDLLLGANIADIDGLSSVGKAFLRREGQPAVILENPEPDASDLFGYSVGLSEDFAVIGSWSDTITVDGQSLEHAGAAYVYVGGDSTLLTGLQGKALFDLDGDDEDDAYRLTAPTPDAFDSFAGRRGAIEVYENYALIGSYRSVEVDGSGNRVEGAAYLYDLTTGEVVQTILDPRRPDARDPSSTSGGDGGTFGQEAVTLTEDYIVIGDGDGDAESVYVFDWGGELLATIDAAALKAEDILNPQAGDMLSTFGFGRSLDMYGDRLVVGHSDERQIDADDRWVSGVGAAYVFDLNIGNTDTTTYADLAGAPAQTGAAGVPAPAGMGLLVAGLYVIWRRQGP